MEADLQLMWPLEYTDIYEIPPLPCGLSTKAKILKKG